MSIVEIVLLAMGLAVDACCLCTVIGLMQKPTIVRTFRLSLPFGVFQGIMPMIGYFGVGLLPAFIFAYNHWIAFGLLAILGGKMTYDVLTEPEHTNETSTAAVATITAGMLFVQGLATSIDALVVGVTLHGQPIAEMLLAVSIVAEVFMHTTCANLAENDKAALLAVKGAESYLVNATVEKRNTDGPLFDTMANVFAEKNMQLKAVWTFTVDKIYDESAGPDGGKQLY